MNKTLENIWEVIKTLAVFLAIALLFYSCAAWSQDNEQEKYENAYNDGYEAAMDDGNPESYDLGYEDGYDEGYKDGYYFGYTDAEEGNKYNDEY